MQWKHKSQGKSNPFYFAPIAESRLLFTRIVPMHAGAELAYSFSCRSHRGAFLILQDYATRSWIEPNSRFTDYIRQYHDSWYAFATDPEKLGLECKPEDIVLVRGTMKTSAWTVGAFLARDDRAHDFAAGGQIANVAGARLKFSSEHSLSHKCEGRSGPIRKQLFTINPSSPLSMPDDIDAMDVVSERQEPQNIDYDASRKDQCVFLSYYKVKYRRFLPKKIVAQAGPSILDKDTEDKEDIAVRGADIVIGTEPEYIPVGFSASIDVYILITAP